MSETKPKTETPAAAEPVVTELPFPSSPLELAVVSFGESNPRTDEITERARQFRDSGTDPDALLQAILSYRSVVAATEAIISRAQAFETFLLED